MYLDNQTTLSYNENNSESFLVSLFGKSNFLSLPKIQITFLSHFHSFP